LGYRRRIIFIGENGGLYCALDVPFRGIFEGNQSSPMVCIFQVQGAKGTQRRTFPDPPVGPERIMMPSGRRSMRRNKVCC